MSKSIEQIAYRQMQSLCNLLGPPSDADIRWAAQRIARDLASAGEAGTDATTQIGAAEGEHATAESRDAQPPSGGSQ